MKRRTGRLLTAASLTAAAAFTGIGAGAVPASAAAQPMSGCSTTTGVVLAVDFSHWGGPVLRACGTTPTTGYDLLNEGGWRTTGTGHDGPAFICRIGYSGYRGGAQYPTSEQDSCVLTPPASAYWSYWHADPGQNSWSYSQLGAMSYHPKPGSVDLWTFGATNVAGTQGRPTISPAAVRARNAAPGSPATHAPPRSHPTTGAPAPPTTHHGATSGSPGASSSASPSTSATASTSSSPSPSGSTTAVAGASPSPSTSILNAAPADAAHQSTGSKAPTIIAIALAVVLGGAAGLTAWRRRRAG